MPIALVAAKPTKAQSLIKTESVYETAMISKNSNMLNVIKKTEATPKKEEAAQILDVISGAKRMRRRRHAIKQTCAPPSEARNTMQLPEQ